MLPPPDMAHLSHIVGKAAAQDAGPSEEKRLTKWVCKVFKELGLNKIENSEN